MNDRFLRACRRQPTDCTPIWLMRQAGRYMPEYRAVRERYGFLEMVKRPEVAAAITMQPINAFALDAAIIFADILPPLEGMGIDLTFEQGEGPVIHNPLRTPADVAALRQPDPHETAAFTLEAIRLVRRELAGRVPLIGFSGAPFTLASYAIEGGGSRDYRRTKQFMYSQPEAWHLLMQKLTTLVIDYLLAQVEAGAQAVQVFDSWAGALAPFDYTIYVLPYVQQCATRLRETGVPTIYFGTDMNGLLPLLRQIDVDVLGVDWRIYLDDAWAQLGPGFAVQGNLDPTTLFAPWPELEQRATDILNRAGGREGHIFNLGHGIQTETPVENVRRLIEYVHEASQI
ncbi:MAG: uroporphyrinogen decarboxylase [Chloroflexaceae bacterium]|nr:uroporphyrinogen decarboxylase [Chloroflexaceae bacterium]NJL34612.1 uroporphyrinogen decarboxylase [Chloroflexaceae bacterium]NJO05837.1 uroporphyrinogen decarboxylase [Chloroflexaceae bacterium]NJO84439.1 uroporphyrinogen decarboxylase [Blastochloris sp.]